MKKVLIGVGGLVVIVIGTLVLVLYNLDGLVKDAIQSVCSEATQTQVRVSDVKLALESGEASISGLNIGNPDGFTDPNIFELGKISIKIDKTTLNQNPIVVDEVIISALSIVYEINKSGISNVDVLKSNLARAGGNADSSGGGEELKMIIRKLLVEGSRAKVRIAALGDVQQTVVLPEIQLTDVGKKSGGATAAEVAHLLSSKLLGNVKSSVTKLGVGQYLGKSADMFKKGTPDKAGQISGAVKGLLAN
jgi:hypothetical protein